MKLWKRKELFYESCRSEGFQLFIPGMFAQGSGTCNSDNKRRNLKCDLRQKRLWEKYAAASAEDGTGTVWKYKRDVYKRQGIEIISSEKVSCLFTCHNISFKEKTCRIRIFCYKFHIMGDHENGHSMRLPVSYTHLPLSAVVPQLTTVTSPRVRSLLRSSSSGAPVI